MNEFAGLDAKRVGIVTPPANPAVEPEHRALLPLDVAMYTTRLPVLAGDLRARTARYADHYEASIASFGALRLDAVGIAMTGASYALGLVGDRELCARLGMQAGAPVWTASLALRDALEALRIVRICLVSPYPPWLTESALGYWGSAGIEVCQVIPFDGEFRAYQLTDSEVAARLALAEPPPGGAIVMSGTGMMSIRAIDSMRERFEVPILSSNICSAWRLMKALGTPATPALEQAAPALAQTLGTGR